MSGQAASYYNPDQSFGAGQQQPQQPQQPFYDYNYNQNGPYQSVPDPEAKYYPPPPAVPAAPPQDPPTYNQAVYGFDEAFKIEKPKFNDIWAGLLVRFL